MSIDSLPSQGNKVGVHLSPDPTCEITLCCSSSYDNQSTSALSS